MYKYENEEQGRKEGQSHYAYWHERKENATEYATLTYAQLAWYEERERSAMEQDAIEAKARAKSQPVEAPATVENSDAFTDERIDRYAKKLVAAANVCFEWQRHRNGPNKEEYLSRREFCKENLIWITNVRNMLLRAMEVTEL